MILAKIFNIAKRAPIRHPLDVFAQLSEEIGELATEINIQTGFRSDRKPGPDGMIGEACDGIICLLDEIYLSQDWYSIDAEGQEWDRVNPLYWRKIY